MTDVAMWWYLSGMIVLWLALMCYAMRSVLPLVVFAIFIILVFCTSCSSAERAAAERRDARQVLVVSHLMSLKETATARAYHTSSTSGVAPVASPLVTSESDRGPTAARPGSDLGGAFSGYGDATRSRRRRALTFGGAHGSVQQLKQRDEVNDGEEKPSDGGG